MTVEKSIPLLSLIVPFHNSRCKSDRLLATLAGLNEPDVEVVLVDDGSNDGTSEYLQECIASFNIRAILIRQDNKGPGGARNTGLREARGRYVWFVDSDDDFAPAAISELRKLAANGFDFIDFDYEVEGRIVDSMLLGGGEHRVTPEVRRLIVRSVGRIWTKMFRRDFLLDHRIFYPEFCLYEDNVLVFHFPFHVANVYKSKIVAYRYQLEAVSITRPQSIFAPTFFDRLAIASRGVEVASRYDLHSEERAAIEKKFIEIFLWNTLSRSRGRTPAWGDLALRVMRHYREEAARLNIGTHPFVYLRGKRSYKARVRLLWIFSRLLPPQGQYFERQHLKGWSQPIRYA